MDTINFFDPRIIFGAIIVFILFILVNRHIKLTKPINPDTIKTCWIKTGYGYGYQSCPSSGLQTLVKILGQPSAIDTKQGGYAVWNKDKLGGKKSIFEKVEIRDQQIPHDKPSPHSDFLYTWYKIDIPQNKLSYLHHISDTIQYDPKQQLLLVRCNDLRSCVIITWITKKFVADEVTQDEAAAMVGPMTDELLQDFTKYHELEYELM